MSKKPATEILASDFKAVTGSEAVCKMRDEFVALVKAFNDAGEYPNAKHAQKLVIALHDFENDHFINDLAWPASVAADGAGCYDLVRVKGED